MEDNADSLLEKAAEKKELFGLESLIGLMMSTGSVLMANESMHLYATGQITPDVANNYLIATISVFTFGMISLGKAVFDCSKAELYLRNAHSIKAKDESAKPYSQ
jgi:hypothetical protein